MTLQRSAFLARILTAIFLAIPTLNAVVRGWNGLEVLVGWIELAAIVALVLPRVWRVGAILLLGVFVVALIHHGSSMMWVVYPAILLLLLLQIDRTPRRSAP